jgi:NitT/TauT family transport system substrate-binding protein
MPRNPLVLCLALAVGVGASAHDRAQAQSRPAPATVRIAYIPVTNYTPMIVARDKGWFTEEGLTVTWSPVNQGAVAIEAVFGGSAEIGGSSIFEPMVARGNGLDMVFAVAGTHTRKEPPDNSALLVRDDGEIKTAKDLAGKKISAGLINSVNYVHMQEWLTKHGVDPKTITFLEIPFPQMADALFQKRIDAVWNVEPFLTFMMKSGKAKLIAYPYTETIPGMDITAYIAKESWLKANPDVARRFKRAIDRATEYLTKASKEERDDWVTKFSGMKLEVVKEMTLPVFASEFNVSSLQKNLDMAVRYRMSKPFDVNTMIWKP